TPFAAVSTPVVNAPGTAASSSSLSGGNGDGNPVIITRLQKFQLSLLSTLPPVPAIPLEQRLSLVRDLTAGCLLYKHRQKTAAEPAMGQPPPQLWMMSVLNPPALHPTQSPFHRLIGITAVVNLIGWRSHRPPCVAVNTSLPFSLRLQRQPHTQSMSQYYPAFV